MKAGRHVMGEAQPAHHFEVAAVEYAQVAAMLGAAVQERHDPAVIRERGPCVQLQSDQKWRKS